MERSRRMRKVLGVVVLAALLAAAGGAAQKAGAKTRKKTLADGRVETSGLVTPGEGESMTLRNMDGRTVVKWTAKTKVALDTNYRQLGGVRGDTIRYRVHSAAQTLEFKLPAGQKYATKDLRRGRVKQSLAEALKEGWLSARGLKIFCAKIDDHLPTDDAPYFAGRFAFAVGRGSPAKLTVGEKVFEVSMKKGGQTNVLVYDVLTPKDCTPYVHRATVIGREVGGAIVADEIHLLPIGDQAAGDDPKLPRYLFIGDSISGNYGRGLRAALKGLANAHHPPTNCGSSGMGVGSIISWLGAHEVRGRHWDVISFNFGHWDAGNTKENYQKNLEIVIGRLKETGAKLLWVTTCPVPIGYGPAGALKNSKAPGTKTGVMAKYLNPWALEVMSRHPEIAICDQWQFVKGNKDGLYTEWWKGRNVHFGGEAADALGRLLARYVLKALGKAPRSK